MREKVELSDLVALDIQEDEFDQMLTPIALSRLLGSPPKYAWQMQVLMDLWEVGSRVALVTPNEAGKTDDVISDAIICFMAMFPGSQVVSTAGAWRQIEHQLMPALTSKLSKFPAWSVTSTGIKAPSVRGLPPSTYVPFSTDDPGKAEGYHGKWREDNKGNRVYLPLLYVIDEAKTVDEKIFQAMHRCDPDHALVASSPGEESGEFYRIMEQSNPDNEEDIWLRHRVTWRDCPHLRHGKALKTRNRLIKDFGENHPFIQSMIFGRFIRSGVHFIFDNKDVVEHGFSPHISIDKSKRKGSLDISGGGDEQVLALRVGNYCDEIHIFHEKDAKVLVRKVVEILLRHNMSGADLTADDGGLGQPVIDFLEGAGFWGVTRYRSDDKAADLNKYSNRYAEDHYHLKKLMTHKSIRIIPDEKLKAQMLRRRFEMPNATSNVIRVEPKKSLRRRKEESPDRLDALVMLFSEFEGDYEYPSINPMDDVVIHDFTPDPFDTRRAEHLMTGGMRICD